MARLHLGLHSADEEVRRRELPSRDNDVNKQETVRFFSSEVQTLITRMNDRFS